MNPSIGRKHRLLFLTVNSSFSHSSLALPLLHSASRDLDQWEWFRYDMTNESDVMTAVHAIQEQHCDLLTTDLYLFNRKTALDVLQRYHVLDPECRIAVGGPECLGSGAEELLARYPWLDRVFRGEGEGIFREYLETFDQESSGTPRIIPADRNAVFQEWESSPYPVTDPFFATDKPFVQIETSRGCPMKCFYCTSGNTRTRYRTLEQVREELQLLSEKGVREIRVLDRTFNLPQERGAALLRMFREEFPQMKFHLELHPQFLNQTLREELQKALPGQLHIEAGVQCLDKEVQHLAGRNSCTEAVIDGLGFLCRQTAFETHADLLAGMPGQTWNHIINDTAVLMKLNTGEIQLEVLKVLPGTPLQNIAADHGLRYSPAPPYDVMKSNTMTLEQIRQVRDLSRLLDLTYNHKYLHEPVLTMSRECPDFTVRLLEFFYHADGSSSAVWNLKKRFLFLLEFCKTYDLKQGKFELAYQWLLAGYPLSQGPDEYSRKAETIPENAFLKSGTKDCLSARETRLWSLSGNGKKYYFAYNRSFALHLPAAVWTVPEQE